MSDAALTLCPQARPDDPYEPYRPDPEPPEEESSSEDEPESSDEERHELLGLAFDEIGNEERTHTRWR